jgi:hypothetical protein
MGEKRNAYRFLMGKPDGKRPLGRPRYMCESNIKMDVEEVELRCKDWIYLAQNRDHWTALINMVMNLRVQ